MNRDQLNRRILWITQTAILTALLIVCQAVTAPLGNSFITGSLVNMMLIISVMTCGLATGITVSVLSPVVALFMGMSPFPVFVPFIILGNITLVILWHLIGNRELKQKYLAYILALISAAIGKFLVLFLGIVQVVIPFLMTLPPAQATVLSTMFSTSQLITASIGGVIAIFLLPTLKKIMNKRHR